MRSPLFVGAGFTAHRWPNGEDRGEPQAAARLPHDDRPGTTSGPLALFRPLIDPSGAYVAASE